MLKGWLFLLYGAVLLLWNYMLSHPDGRGFAKDNGIGGGRSGGKETGWLEKKGRGDLRGWESVAIWDG